jgi:hypothetical protein
MLDGMRGFAMLLGSFLFTFSVLALGWMTLLGGGQPRPAASSMPSASPASSAQPRPQPSITPPATGDAPTSAEPTASPASTVTASATATATPAPTLAPTPQSTTSQTYVLVGAAYTSSEIPDRASIEPSGDGIALVTSTDDSDPLRVTYALDNSELPAGAHVLRAAVRVCGDATGTPYELDGPLGTSQSIVVSLPPESDGCWHLDAEAPFDLTVAVVASGGARVEIRSVEYALTLAR